MWNKLPGFRSNNKRNKLIAAFGYSFYALGLRPMFETGVTTWDGIIGVVAWTILFFGILIPSANLFNARKSWIFFTRMNKIFGTIAYVFCVLLIAGAVSITLESGQAKTQREEVATVEKEESTSLKDNEMVTEEGLGKEDVKPPNEEKKLIAASDKPKETTVDSVPVSVEKEDDINTDINLIQAEIVKVTDGDTLRVLIGNKEESIRLLLVDTPESVHPDIPEPQAFALEASQFAKETLKIGENVGIEFDVSERDKYGRLLAYVWVGDKMFNEMLLEKGLARVAYIYPPNVKYVDRYRAVQEKAQKAGVGIWSIENYAQADGFHDEAVNESSPGRSQTTPTESVSNDENSVVYASCADVRKAGKDPLRQGDPGYSTKLDRDRDGVACE